MEKATDLFQYSKETCNALVSGFFGKCAASIAFIIVQISFSGVEKVMLLAIGLLIVIDFTTAIIATKMSGKEVTSRKAFKSAVKSVMYGLLIVTGSLLEVTMKNALPIADTIAVFIAVTEGISIIENVGKAGYVVPKKLLNTLKDLQDDK